MLFVVRIIIVMRLFVILRDKPVFVVMNGLMARNTEGYFNVEKLLNGEKLLVGIGRLMITFLSILLIDIHMSGTAKMATGIEIVKFPFTKPVKMGGSRVMDSFGWEFIEIMTRLVMMLLKIVELLRMERCVMFNDALVVADWLAMFVTVIGVLGSGMWLVDVTVVAAIVFPLAVVVLSRGDSDDCRKCK